MQHLVRYTMPGGHHEYRDAASLEEAARLVETARNDYGASDAQIFREVPIEFKVQYKVTVADAASTAAPATPAAPPVSDPAPIPPAMPPVAQPSEPPPVAQPSEPPPGAMPLAARPVPSSTDESADAEAEGESAPENVTPIGGEGASRRTLFGRS